jgi:hypothetical protein
LKKCKRFPSQEYAASKARRLRRIGTRATPDLSQAFAAGKITLRQYDLASRLPLKQQRARIAILNREIEGAKIAAEVIDEILDGTKGDHVRLAEISLAIREAVQGAHAF